MRAEKVMVKNYNYTLRNLLLLWFGAFVCLFFVLWPFLIGKIICGSLAVFFLLWAICLPRFSKTYDVFSHEGIKRINRGDIYFDLPWNDIESVSYLGIIGIIILSQNTLYLYPKQAKGEILPFNLSNYDNKKCISVQLSRRDYEHINKTFIPSNVRRIK